MLTFNQSSGLWLEKKRPFVRQSTYSIYSVIIRRHLIPAFGDSTSITEEDVQQFVIRETDAGMSIKTVKDSVTVLSMIARFCAKMSGSMWQHWEIKYPREQKPGRVPVLSAENWRKLFFHCTENFSFRNIGILISLCGGLRIGEVCALQWDDLDLSEGVLHISKSASRVYDVRTGHSSVSVGLPKTPSSFRDVPMPKPVLRMLRPMKKLMPGQYYVVSGKPSPTEPRTLRYAFEHLLKELDIPHIKYHGLRHSFATRCIEKKNDCKTVSAILGHSTVGTTLNLYVHPDLTAKRKCVEGNIPL